MKGELGREEREEAVVIFRRRKSPAFWQVDRKAGKGVFEMFCGRSMWDSSVDRGNGGPCQHSFSMFCSSFYDIFILSVEEFSVS